MLPNPRDKLRSIHSPHDNGSGKQHMECRPYVHVTQQCASFLRFCFFGHVRIVASTGQKSIKNPGVRNTGAEKKRGLPLLAITEEAQKVEEEVEEVQVE